MKFSDNLVKVLFVLSLVVLVFLYGFVSGYKSWPPKGFLDKALEQARDIEALSFLPLISSSGPPRTSPQVYSREGVRSIRPNKIQPGLTLITSQWKWKGSGDLKIGAKLIDQNGQTLHSWQLDREQLFPSSMDLGGRNTDKADIHGTYLFPNGDLLINLEYIGTVRVNACGKVKWRLQEFNHHSIHRASDGTFWTPATYKSKRSGSKLYPDGFPGLEGESVRVDRILHINEQGKILKNINVLDVIYENGLENYISPEAWEAMDITHLNDVEPLRPSMAGEYPLFEAGDLLVSLRHLNLVFVFDPETMSVKWHASEPFILQHDPDFIGDGLIGIFNNNDDAKRFGKMFGESQIITIEPSTGTVEVRFPKKRIERFFTGSRGKWQLLDNGNVLLTESNAGRVVEVTQKGQIVWEWIHKSYSDWVPSVTKATRYDLTKKDVASWPCSSVSTSENTEQEGG